MSRQWKTYRPANGNETSENPGILPLAAGGAAFAGKDFLTGAEVKFAGWEPAIISFSGVRRAVQEVLQLQPELEGFKSGPGLFILSSAAGRTCFLTLQCSKCSLGRTAQYILDYDVEGLPVTFFVDKAGLRRD